MSGETRFCSWHFISANPKRMSDKSLRMFAVIRGATIRPLHKKVDKFHLLQLLLLFAKSLSIKIFVQIDTLKAVRLSNCLDGLQKAILHTLNRLNPAPCQHFKPGFPFPILHATFPESGRRPCICCVQIPHLPSNYCCPCTPSCTLFDVTVSCPI